MHYHRKPEWAMPEREATPESIFMNRRKFLAGSAGVVAGGILGAAGLSKLAESKAKDPKDMTLDLYPAKRNPAFTLDRPLTEESVAAKYNNFYEFGGTKTIHRLAQRLKTRPWEVKVHGLVRKPKTYDIDSLVRSMPLEERLLRFRCVEAWAMAVPWTGVPYLRAHQSRGAQEQRQIHQDDHLPQPEGGLRATSDLVPVALRGGSDHRGRNERDGHVRHGDLRENPCPSNTVRRSGSSPRGNTDSRASSPSSPSSSQRSGL